MTKVIPTAIHLLDRYGSKHCLNLISGSEHFTEYGKIAAKYTIDTEFPVGLDGEKDAYIAIDFSGGPKLFVGEKVQGISYPLGACEMVLTKIENNTLILETIMTNTEIRKFLRKHGWDIEITVIASIEGVSKHTGKYRYLVSHWNTETKELIKNYYNSNEYNSYEEAENAAIALINNELSKTK